MRLNQSLILSPNDPLVIEIKPINIVDDFKYPGSYVGSTERDFKVRIALAWAAFAKIKSILRSPKVNLNFKICLFKSACISISSFARTCYRIMIPYVLNSPETT